MLNSVVFISRAQAEALTGNAEWAVISISEPGEPQANLCSKWHSVLRLSFHDVDVEASDQFTLFTLEQAKEVLQFTANLPDTVAGVVVHCHAGVSRSAAVAKAVAEWYALPFPEAYSIYNKQVYRLLTQAYWYEQYTNG